MDKSQLYSASLNARELPFKTALKKTNRRVKSNKQQLVDETKYLADKTPNITYFNVRAPPSLKPNKKYCDITGLVAPYKSTNGMRFHSSEVYSLIRSMQVGEEQVYLELRGDGVVLR